MSAKPNIVQRVIHRFVMLKPVTAFFAPRVHRIDKAILRFTGGRHTVSEILGWNIVQLTTTGAKSGQPHTMPLIGVRDGEKIALIASSFGRKRNPAWYYNLKAHPECTVQENGRLGHYRAREAQDQEYQRLWGLAVSAYAGYEQYKARAGRRIPIMILEPRT
jgi:deazaflavin-dependent oxidoreductase (nitroreductase family)